jgi:DNA-binding beta-propeller fold protein YncE
MRTFQKADPPGSIWTFDSTGKFVREWGKGVAIEGHGLRVDRDGFIWTTDVQGHQVKKFHRDGTLVMTLGKAEVPGDGPDTFNCPTDVLVTPNGDIFVSDGYGNQRVVKFDKHGKFIKAWGGKGTGPGQFRLPHAIVQDSHGRIIVADRCGLGETGCMDNRIQIFDTDGKVLDEWPIKATTIEIAPGDQLYAVTREGVVIVDANTGKVLETIEKVGGHGISVDRNGTLYTASPGDVEGVRRYTRKPTS